MEKDEKDKLLGLDVGERFIGLAIAYANNGMVFPRDPIDCKRNDPKQELKRIIQEDQIEHLVVGLPLNADGSSNQQCDKTKAFIEELRKVVDIEVSYENEYASSLEAKQRLTIGQKASSSNKTKLKKGSIDSTAASIILETHLAKLCLH